jgi:hypothetical protein
MNFPDGIQRRVTIFFFLDIVLVGICEVTEHQEHQQEEQSISE